MMTMRTRRNFICDSGHEGVETKSENDQPYSRGWESIDSTGMHESGKDERGNVKYVCSTCGKPMKPADKR